MLLVQYISLAIAIVAIILAVFLYRLSLRKHASIYRAIKLLEEKNKLLERSQNQLNEVLHEVRSGALGVGNKVKELESVLIAIQSQQNELSNKQVELEQQDATQPMYTRAAKLVASGASIEDIMEECDLPRAEAELLLSLHKGR